MGGDEQAGPGADDDGKEHEPGGQVDALCTVGQAEDR
jgi:hypothetical protein